MNRLESYIENATEDLPNQVLLLNVDGGTITKDQIDTLTQIKGKDTLSISGLTQDTFEYLIANYGKKFKAINFWKCPRVADLAPIESLRNIKYLTFFWNQRATRFWDFQKTPKLVGLSFRDFTKLHDAADLEKASSLRELDFGDMVENKYKIESLEPLASMTNLRRLYFTPKKIVDERIEPIAKLTELKDLFFPSNLFTTEQVAWLTTRLPKTVKSEVLGPYRKIKKPLEIGGKLKDTFILGKGKPFLDPAQDNKRVEKYVAEFSKRVAWFSEHPSKMPHEYA